MAIAGQSNANGFHTDSFTSPPTHPYVMLRARHDTLEPPYSRIKALSYGPEYGLVNTIGAAGVKILKHSQNGTSVQYWLDVLQAEHIAATPAGWVPEWLLLVHGEAETQTVDGRDNYQSRCETLIANYRTAWGSGLKVAIALVTDSAEYIYAPEIRAAQTAIAAADPLIYTITTSDLPKLPDDHHYTGAGQQTLGARFAALVTA